MALFLKNSYFFYFKANNLWHANNIKNLSNKTDFFHYAVLMKGVKLLLLTIITQLGIITPMYAPSLYQKD